MKFVFFRVTSSEFIKTNMDKNFNPDKQHTLASSISISGTQEQVRRLTEQVALLRADLEEVASSDTETS